MKLTMTGKHQQPVQVLIGAELIHLERKLDRFKELQVAVKNFLDHTNDTSTDVVRMRVAMTRLEIGL